MEGSSHSKFVAHNIITTSNIHYCDTHVLLAMDRRYMESQYIQRLSGDTMGKHGTVRRESVVTY